MATSHPTFARNDSRHRPWGAMAPGVKENLNWWHIVPVLLIGPRDEVLDAANRGEVWGAASFTAVCIYVRLDLGTNKLWFLEYKLVGSKANGMTKTLKWFDEGGARTRWWTDWLPLHENAGVLMPIQPMYLTRPDSSFDYGRMRLQYRGLQFTENTPGVGGPNLAHIHDGRPPTPG